MPTHLILLPGLMCDREVWQAQTDSLSADFNILVADYGLANDLGAMAEQVLAQTTASRFAVAGHSMGGRVALEMVRRAPERVSHLALLDTGAHPLAVGGAGETERAGRMALLTQARGEGMEAMARVWAQPMVHPGQVGTPLFEAIVQMICRSTPDIFAAQIQALLNRPDARPVLPTVGVPTLLLTGAEDNWSPPAQHAQMGAEISGSRLVVLDGCGHMSPMEAPQQVSAAFREWLA